NNMDDESEHRLPVFTAEDEEIITLLAHQAAICLEISEEQRTTSRQLARIRDLLHVSHTMSSMSNIQELFSTIMLQTSALLSAQRGKFFLLDPTTNELWSMEVMKAGEMKQTRQPLKGTKLGAGIPGKVLLTGQSINIVDAYLDPAFNPVFDQDGSGTVTKSMMCVPVKRKDGTVLGVLQLINKLQTDVGDHHAEHMDEHEESKHIILENTFWHKMREAQNKNAGHRVTVTNFSTEDFEILEALAPQMAVAVENVETMSKLEKQRHDLECVMTQLPLMVIVLNSSRQAPLLM
ncbi:hypothetical protein CYMTET_25547, partial [Cymbomonas tetramitiformis]